MLPPFSRNCCWFPLIRYVLVYQVNLTLKNDWLYNLLPVIIYIDTDFKYFQKII
jgi:hypothetical protein